MARTKHSSAPPFVTYEDPVSVQEFDSTMPARPGKLVRSLSRPFTDVRNYLRVSLRTSDRGINSAKATALEEQRRRSGGVGPSCFDEQALSSVEHESTIPIASTSRSPPASPEDDIPEPSSAVSDPFSSVGLSSSGGRGWDSMLPSPSSPDTLPTDIEAVDDTPSFRPSPSPPLRTPPRLSTASFESPEGQPRWKGKARAQHPVLVETCPTPPSSAKYRPGSRQRSIMNPSGLGIDVDEFEYGEEDEDDVEVLEQDNGDDPDEHDSYRRRPSAAFSLPLHSSTSNSALPFPSDLIVESLLSHSSPHPSTSTLASPHSSPRQYRTQQHRNFTPPLHHLRPLRKSEIINYSPSPRPTAQELRAKASNSTLFSWDLAHLPAPGTPRERPYRVGLMSLISPSFALGGGKGSGRYGDTQGPIERQQEEQQENGGLRRTLSKRSAKVRRSIGAWSIRSRREEPENREALEDWVALVIAE